MVMAEITTFRLLEGRAEDAMGLLQKSDSG
jgi:hypothetical protein